MKTLPLYLSLSLLSLISALPATAAPALSLIKVEISTQDSNAVCSVNAAKTTITQTKIVKKKKKTTTRTKTTAYTADISDGAVAMAAFEQLGDLKRYEGPSDNPLTISVRAEHYENEILVFAQGAGEIQIDASPIAAQVRELVMANCGSVIPDGLPSPEDFQGLPETGRNEPGGPQPGPRTGSGMPPLELLQVSIQGRQNAICSANVIETRIVQDVIERGRKISRTSVAPTAYTSSIADGGVAMKVFATLGSLSAFEGPTDASSIQVSVYEFNQEHVIYSRIAGQILVDLSPNYGQIRELVEANCGSIVSLPSKEELAGMTP